MPREPHRTLADWIQKNQEKGVVLRRLFQMNLEFTYTPILEMNMRRRFETRLFPISLHDPPISWRVWVGNRQPLLERLEIADPILHHPITC